eukprot:SAG31_NODE_5704_length_2371_cov_2.281250_2_plen_102_part_00
MRLPVLCASRAASEPDARTLVDLQNDQRIDSRIGLPQRGQVTAHSKIGNRYLEVPAALAIGVVEMIDLRQPSGCRCLLQRCVDQDNCANCQHLAAVARWPA